MYEVVPSVNCPVGDFECVKERTRLAGKLLGGQGWIHLDIADGIFTPHKTWNEPALWEKTKCAAKLEVHLMVDDPEHWADAWLSAGAERLIVHTSALTPESWDAIEKMASERGAALILGLNPETDVREADAYKERASGFLVLGVHPGLSGQKFLPLMLKKIELLRDAHPDAIIEVDGGVDAEVGARALRAGANVLISATYIFGNDSPETAYKELTSL